MRPNNDVPKVTRDEKMNSEQNYKCYSTDQKKLQLSEQKLKFKSIQCKIKRLKYMKRKKKVWRKCRVSLVCRELFSTHGHQLVRIIFQTFLSLTLNGITYVVRHEKLIHWSLGNVKGNDLRSSLPP